MTYKTYKSSPLIPPHGGYRNLASYQNAEIVYDLIAHFVREYRSYTAYKTYMSYKNIDQIIGAARSGKQNIAEGSQVSGTSKKSEIKLISVARGSLEELLQDMHDFLRIHQLPLWERDDTRVQKIRALAYSSNKSYMTYETYMTSAENAVNCIICLIHQTNFLLDRQIASLEKAFLEEGGFTERLYRERRATRGY